MILDWWRRRRRNKIAARPFPAEWERILSENIRQYRTLDETARHKLQRTIQIFVAEKWWEGCNGLAITDEIKVTIAGQAARLVLGFDAEYFDKLQTILVYPNDYFARESHHDPGGIVTEGTARRLGEAWSRGPVVLSWANVRSAGREHNGGRNVVLHEFAHVLDMDDSEMNGTPVLSGSEQYATWQDVMTSEYNRLVQDAARGRPTLLDEYGTTNPAEFFAVATECFFEWPRRMHERHPKLYEALSRFYRQDPARRASSDEE